MGLQFGELAGRMVSQRIQAGVANAAALATAYSSKDLDDKMIVALGDGTTWQYAFSSAAADATGQLVVTPNDTIGRWLRLDKQMDIKLPVDFTLADAAVLLTVPVGFRLQPTRPFWENTIAWTGGASSAIGLSSSNAAYNTKGDLLGGAGGDLTAAMGVGFKGGVGTKIASLGLVVLVAGDTVRFDRVVSAYTAGAGFAHFPCEQVAL
jgi:hypothetical protein